MYWGPGLAQLTGVTQLRGHFQPNKIFFDAELRPAQPFGRGQNWSAQDRGLIIPPRPSFLYAEWILHAGADWSRGKREGKKRKLGGQPGCS